MESWYRRWFRFMKGSTSARSPQSTSYIEKKVHWRVYNQSFYTVHISQCTWDSSNFGLCCACYPRPSIARHSSRYWFLRFYPRAELFQRSRYAIAQLSSSEHTSAPGYMTTIRCIVTRASGLDMIKHWVRKFETWYSNHFLRLWLRNKEIAGSLVFDLGPVD